MDGFLDYITIKGFKSIASVEKLPLRPVNIVIGANGVGKSNFIQVFDLLRALRDGRLKNYIGSAGNADRLLHFGAKTTPKMELGVAFDKQINEYNIVLVAAEGDSLYPDQEIVGYWHKERYDRPYTEILNKVGVSEAAISQEGLRSKTAVWVRKRLESWRVYHFHDTGRSSPMKKTADIDDNRFLRPDGENLAAFLYLLKLKHPESYGLILRTVQRVMPALKDFELAPSLLNETTIQLEWSHVGSEKRFDAAALSDGSLRFIALATLFLQPEQFRPSLIIVDEPELGLHPAAITLLASLVNSVSTQTQVIVATQSALLLDHFEPEDVLVAELKGQGTVLRRLEPEPLECWLEDYSLGQLWEKNELGGRPHA